MRFAMCFALALGLLPGLSTANAATFVVTSPANDSDALLTDDLCDVGTGACTLRAAIEQANATPGADRVEFDIAGGPHTIAIGTAPGIFEEVEIDATTQPGSSVNSAATGTNAVLGIILTGDSPLYVAAPNVVIRGLSIRGTPSSSPCVLFDPASTGSRFFGNSVSGCDMGILVDGNAVRIGGELGAFAASRNLIGNNHFGIVVAGSNNFVVDNSIGTNASGTGPFGNAGPGIELWGNGNAVTDNVIAANAWGLVIYGDANTLVRNRIGGDRALQLGNNTGIQINGSGNQIGSPSASLTHSNEIYGNGTGLLIHGAVSGGGGNFVRGNRFGRLGIGSGGAAIQIQGSSGNQIAGNQIDHNAAGVQVLDTPSTPAIDNRISANRIWANPGFNLKLAFSGSPHDDAVFGLPPDYDEGPNHLQNPPHVTYVSITQGQTTIAGDIDAQAGPYTLDFFSSSFCGAGGVREGEFYVGSAQLSATGDATSPRTSFQYTLPVTAQGRGFTATATDVDGNTSEFSNCFSAAFAGGADLVLTGTLTAQSAPLTLNPGDAIRFSLRIENRGPFVATSIPVVVSTPPGFLGAWIPDPANASRFDAATATWTLPSLAVGGVALLDLDATVDSAAAGGFSIHAEALAGLSQYDPNGADNALTRAGSVRSGADLEISQSAPSAAQDDDVVSFDVTVTNTGPRDAASVTASGELGAGLVFESASAPGVQSALDPHTGRWRWTWDAGDLPDQAFASLRIDARVVAALAPPDYGLTHTVGAFAASPRDPSPFLSTQTVGLGATAEIALRHFETASLTLRDANGNATDYVALLEAQVSNGGPDAIDEFVLRVESCGTDLLRWRSGVNVQPTVSGQAACPSGGEAPIPCPLVCRLSAGTNLASGDGVNARFERTSAPGSTPADSFSARVEADPSSPFFDPTPGDNARTWEPFKKTHLFPFGWKFTCGSMGIESPILLGLMLVPWRRGRRAVRRVLRGAFLALALIVAPAEVSRAAPFSLVVDSAASSASFALSGSLGSPPPAAIALSGSIDADVTLTSHALLGLVADSVRLTGGAIALSDASVLLESFPLYALTISGTGIGATASGPIASGFPSAPGLSLFDLAGSSLSFDTGSISAAGSYFGLPLSDTLDFSVLPFDAIFPAGSIAQLEVADLGGGVAALRFTLPFAATLHFTIDAEPVVVTIAGTLVLAGQSVPEPDAALLLAAVGVLGLAVWSKPRGSVLRIDDRRR